MVAGILFSNVKQAPLNRAFGVHRIGAGLVYCHRVKGGEHPYILNNGKVVAVIAVAVGGNLIHQGNVKMRSAVQDGF